MKRYVSLEEISDGRLYDAQDLVKADCLGCKGCSKCCRGMGDTIILDPMDVYRFQTQAGLLLGTLLEDGRAALGVVDGLIMPHLQMTGEEEACGFLDHDGRCSVHSARPGICRLFPLGRYYEGDTFRYFLQTGECDHPKAKIKIAKWMEIPEFERYEAYIRKWHALAASARELMNQKDDDELARRVNMFVLKVFYLMPYEQQDFYAEFDARILKYHELLRS